MTTFNTRHPLIARAANFTKDAKQINAADFTEEDELYLQMCRWIWSQYASDRTYLTPDGHCSHNQVPTSEGTGFYSIAELRAYSRGQQSIIPYQRILDPDRVTDGKQQQGLMNINWTPPQILPKVVSQLEGMYDPVDFDYQITASDARSQAEREKRRAKMRLALSEDWKQLEQTVGREATNKILPKGVQDPADLEIMFRLGGDKLLAEIKMEAAVRASLADNDYSGVVSEMLKRDAIDLGFVATEVRVDPLTGRPQVDRVDPESLVIPRSRYRDFRDAGYAGRVVRMKVHELISELIAEGMSVMDAEDHVARIAQQHAANLGGDQGLRLRNEGFKDEDEIFVFRGYFIAAHMQKYVVRSHKRTGSTVYAPVKRDAKLRKDDKKNGAVMETVRTQYTYRVSWVVGTNFIYDYGRDYAIAREGKEGQKVARLPIQAYRLDSPSMVARCIPIVDDLTLATYKKRDGLTKIIPAPGILVDLSLVDSEVVIGGERVTFSSLLGLAYRSGVLMYKSTEEALARGMLNGGVPPIREVDNAAIARVIETFSAEVQTGLMEIRNVTGLNELQDNTARPDLLVGIARGIQASTNNSLLHVFRAYLNVSKAAVRYLVLKYQTLLTYGDITVYDIPILGAASIEHVITQAEAEYDFILSVEGRPTEEEKQELSAMAIRAQDGGILDIPDYLEFQRLMRSGQIRAATLFLAIATDRNKRRMEQVAMQQQAMNAEVQQASAQATAEQERQTKMLDHELKVKFMQAEVIAELRKELTLRTAGGEMDMVKAGIEGELAQGEPNQTQQQMAQ